MPQYDRKTYYRLKEKKEYYKEEAFTAEELIYFYFFLASMVNIYNGVLST